MPLKANRSLMKQSAIAISYFDKIYYTEYIQFRLLYIKGDGCVTQTVKDYSVPALEKSIMILNALSASGELSINDLHQRSGVAKSTIFVILNTLERHNLVEKTDDGKFRLGHGIFQWGMSFHQRIDLNPIARPVLASLVEQTPFTAHTAVLAETKAVYIDKCEGNGFVRFTTSPGQSLPLHLSAVGRALVSDWPDEQIAALYNDHMDYDKAKKNCSLDMLMDEIQFVRQHGFSIDDEQMEDGVRSVGAPIRNAEGAIVAAIDITALSKDLPAIKIHTVGEKVLEAARHISSLLGLAPQK